MYGAIGANRASSCTLRACAGEGNRIRLVRAGACGVAIRHAEERKTLRTLDDATTPVQRALAEPLGESGASPLRSLELTDDGIRLAFAPFTAPDVVEQHLRRAVAVLEASQVSTGTAYR